MPEPETEVEIVCARCGYRTTRTPARLRRGTKIVCRECGSEIVPPRGDDKGGDDRGPAET